MNLSICTNDFKYKDGVFTFEAQDLDNETYHIVEIDQFELENYYGSDCNFSWKDCAGKNNVVFDAADSLLESNPEKFDVRNAIVKQVEFIKSKVETIIIPGAQFIIDGLFSHASVIANKQFFGASDYNIVLI